MRDQKLSVCAVFLGAALVALDVAAVAHVSVGKMDLKTYPFSDLSPDQEVTAEVTLPDGVKEISLKPFRMAILEF